MRIRVSLFSLLLIYVLFSYSCNKNEDSTPPIIEVLAPSENTSYNTFDSIFVKANISDEQELTFVSVELLNADLISVITPFGRNLATNQYNLHATLIIDNIHLQSGKHYILITAKDSKNITRSYIEVYVYGIPYETVGYVSFENLGDQYEVHNYINNSDSIMRQSVGELKGGLVDTYNQQYGVLIAPDGPFEAYPLYPFIDEWEVPIKLGGITFCRAQSDKLSIQLGFKGQLLSFYQGEDELKTNFSSAVNYSPYYSLDKDEDIVTWQRTANSGSNRIETFFQSGALKQVTNYNYSIVQFLPKSDDFIYVISNSSSNAYMDIYNLESGVIQSQEFENMQFYDACIDNDGNLYIANEDEILKYNPISLQVSTFSTTQAVQLSWDRVQEVLVVASENQLLLFNSLGMQVQAYNLSGDCVELSVWYSK